MLILFGDTNSYTTQYKKENERLAAVYVYYGPDNMKQYVIDQVKQFQELGYKMYFIANGNLPTNRELPASVEIDTRENTGFDWGGWDYALKRWPKLRDYDRVLFTNDSYITVKTTEELRDLIEKQRLFGKSWGMSLSHELGDHLQSYFLEILQKDYPVFFNHIVNCDKGDGKTVQTIINNCEIKTLEVIGDATWAFDPGEKRNPYLDDIEYMLEQGFPLIKKRTPQDKVNHLNTKDFYD